MSKDKSKTQKQLDSKKKQSRRQKGIIIGLSIALALAGGAAVATPLIIAKNKPVAVTQYTVTFDANNTEGTKTTSKVNANETVSKPLDPYKKDCTFTGWYTNKIGGSKFDFRTQITKDITLYAHWVDSPTPPTETYTVTFDADGGVPAPISVKVAPNSCINLPAVSKSGYTLLGWKHGNDWVTSTTPITGDNWNLVAQWEETPVVETFTVTYSCSSNTGSYGEFVDGSDITTQKVESGKSATAPTVTIKAAYAEDYETIGWYTDKACTTPADTSAPITKDTILYQGYKSKIQTATLSFEVDNAATLHGSSTLTVKKKSKWKDIKSQAPIASKNLYSWNGWLLNGATIDDEYEFTDNVTLTASFTALTHVFTFNFKATGTQTIKDVTDPTSYTMKYDVGEVPGTQWKNIPKPTYEDGTNIFSGWFYYDEDGRAVTIDDDYYFTTTEGQTNSLNIYATFTAPQINPTISFVNPTESNSTYTWVGARTFKAESTSVSWSSVSKPGVFKDVTNESTGFTEGYKSDYVFDAWKTKDSEGQETDVPDDISSSIEIYPTFKDKPSIKFVDEDGAEISGFGAIRPNPTDTWDTVLKPEYTPKAPTTTAFNGWKGTISDDGGKTYNERVLKPTDLISNLKAGESIKPNILTSFNNVEFITTGIINPISASSQPIEVTYTGTPKIGIEKKVTNFVDINKPIASAPDSVTGTSYVFKSWQYSLDSGLSWKIPGTGSEIPAESTATVLVRPVMEAQIKITYDAGDHGSIPETQTGIIKTDSSKTFGSIYKPNLDINTGYIFDHWEDTTNPGTALKDTDQFTKDTTIKAIYVTSKKTAIVNFLVNPTDEAASAKVATAKFAKEHDDGDVVTWADIDVRPYASKPRFVFNNKWAIRTGSGTKSDPYKYDTLVTDDTVVPDTGLNVYAVFDQETHYQKISVAEPTASEYEILSNPNEQYAELNKAFPLSTLELKVKKPGYAVDYWTYVKSGETEPTKIDTTTIVTDDMVITPVFKECNWEVRFEKGDYPLCSMDTTRVLTIGNWYTLNDKIADIKASLDKHDFTGWKILKNGSQLEIPDNYEVTEPLTLVPTFKGESEYKQGTQPYFFDEKKGKWCAIKDCSENKMIGRYAGETVDSEIEKTTFNYEVKFGAQMTSIPDYFMQGCINWNNAGKPLVLPNNLTSIGKNVLYGCASFNQDIKFTDSASGVAAAATLTIGENFMRECYSFNKDIDMSTSLANANVTIGFGFMFDCMSFSSTLNLCGRTFLPVTKYNEVTREYEYATPEEYYYTLSTSDSLSGMYLNGFTIKINDATVSKFKIGGYFDKLDGTLSRPFRNCKIQQV